jgi:hypothetical protein
MLKYVCICFVCIAVLIGEGWMLEVAANSPETESVSGGSEIVESRSTFIHTVLFWLKEDTTESQKNALVKDCKDLLGTISSVRYLAVGLPAGTPREVVDNSFGVGLVVHFDDEAGHEIYQKAEKHLEFIERNQHVWVRVQVYDIAIP